MRYLFSLLLISFCIISCRPSRDPAAEAIAFKDLLAESIRNADEIEVVEYPNRSDDPKSEYRSTTLDGDQRKLLEQLVVNTPPAEQTAFHACFIPHHSIRFFKNGVQTSELEVCLECIAVRLSSTHLSAPKAMPSTISSFMETLGYRKLNPEEKQSGAAKKPDFSSPADIPGQSKPPETAKDK